MIENIIAFVAGCYVGTHLAVWGLWALQKTQDLKPENGTQTERESGE